jgi:hypothetical protein
LFLLHTPKIYSRVIHLKTQAKELSGELMMEKKEIDSVPNSPEVKDNTLDRKEAQSMSNQVQETQVDETLSREEEIPTGRGPKKHQDSSTTSQS